MASLLLPINCLFKFVMDKSTSMEASQDSVLCVKSSTLDSKVDVLISKVLSCSVNSSISAYKKNIDKNHPMIEILKPLENNFPILLFTC